MQTYFLKVSRHVETYCLLNLGDKMMVSIVYILVVWTFGALQRAHTWLSFARLGELASSG